MTSLFLASSELERLSQTVPPGDTSELPLVGIKTFRVTGSRLNNQESQESGKMKTLTLILGVVFCFGMASGCKF